MFERCDPEAADVRKRADWIARSVRPGSTDGVERPAMDARLRVGPAGDRHEREADEIARRVVRSLASGVPGLDRDSDATLFPGHVESTRIRRLSTVAPIGRGGGPVDVETAQEINARRGRGQPIEAGVRRSMEHAFGTDLSRVRLHHGPDVADVSARFGAQAFTVGSDVYFGRGLPDTSGSAGQFLLAHELAHTTQQAPGPVVRRYGEHELDPRPDSTMYLVADDERRLRRFEAWLNENNWQFRWLGLYEEELAAPAGNLAERLEWAITHVPMWLGASVMPQPHDWTIIDSIFDDGDAWLEAHRDLPFAHVDNTIGECRRLGLDWLADELNEKKQPIYRLVTTGKRGDGHEKRAGIRTRSLNELASSLDPVLAALSSKANEFDDIRTDVGESLDQIDVWTEAGVSGRQGFIGEARRLRNELGAYALALGPPRRAGASKKKRGDQPPPRAAAPDRVNDLQQLIGGAGNVVVKLSKLQVLVMSLGEKVETAFELLPAAQQRVAQKPKADIVIPGTMGPKDIAKMLPTQFTNILDVANDIINKPQGGWTPFTVRGSVVYHSSTGSKNAGNQAGSAFWINQGNDRVIVAMGRHAGNKTDEYRIEWRAQGVNGKYVKLSPKVAADLLTG
jgi:hypothetical protein